MLAPPGEHEAALDAAARAELEADRARIAALTPAEREAIAAAYEAKYAYLDDEPDPAEIDGDYDDEEGEGDE